MKEYILANGVRMPAIGFGTFKALEGEAENAVRLALEAGYRLIDGAAIYSNEVQVGKGIAQSGVKRADIFVTSKLWNDQKGYKSTLAAFDKTLNDLGLDYLDLYLIHWPVAKASRTRWQQANAETWQAFEELYNKGKIRALGVSNFMPHHFQALAEGASIAPMVNQIEFHPGSQQAETVAYCRQNNILVESWGPLARGEACKNESIMALAQKYGKTPGQVLLRWIVEKDIVPLPKSVTKARIENNLDVFGFALSAKDHALIDTLTDIKGSGAHPDHIDF